MLSDVFNAKSIAKGAQRRAFADVRLFRTLRGLSPRHATVSTRSPCGNVFIVFMLVFLESTPRQE